MRKFIRENKGGIIGIIIVFLIIFLVSIGGTSLIKSGNEAGLLLILTIAIFWIIWLYISRGEIKEKYKQLLNFSHKFYKESKKAKADEYDNEDYTLGEFESEFEEWLMKRVYKNFIKNDFYLLTQIYLHFVSVNFGYS